MFNILIGIILSLIYINLILPKKEKNCPYFNFTIKYLFYNGMIYIKLNEKQTFHLHHWLLFFIILLIFNDIPIILKTFLIISIIHALLNYKDSFEFIEDNPYKNDIN